MKCGVVILILIAASAFWGFGQTPEPPPVAAPPVNSPVLPEPPAIVPSPPQAPTELPILTAPPPPKPPQEGFRGSSADVIRVVVGLFVLFGLAYLGGRPSVRQIEQSLGLSHLITAGLPFVFLGAIASHPSVDVLSTWCCTSFGHCWSWVWVGSDSPFGFRFDSDLMKSLLAGNRRCSSLTAAWPFAAALLALRSRCCGSPKVPRARAYSFATAILLGTAGAMTGSTTADLLRARGVAERFDRRASGP